MSHLRAILALGAVLLTAATAQTVINGIPGQNISPSGPLRTTLVTMSGSAVFDYSSAGFSITPTVNCTVENTSTTQAFVPQIAAKSLTQATINVLGSQAPLLSGNLLNIANINVGQPFAPIASTPMVSVDCIAAMPTQ